MSSSSAEQEPEQIRVKKKPNGTGRKKIEMKKIEKNSSRKVAFSKRRQGLFKKGGELCRLCDAMIAIIVFSPKGRIFSYGYPSVDSVIDQFQSEEDEGQQQQPEDQNQYNVGDERGSISLSHDENCDCVTCVSENSAAEAAEEGGEEEEEEEEDEEEEEEEEEEYWWEEDIEGMELEELERRRACMEELRDNMTSSLEEMIGRRFHERDLLGGFLP